MTTLAAIMEPHKNAPARGKSPGAGHREVPPMPEQAYKPECCESCGAATNSRLLHGHHADYSKPLEVEWLCRKCHLAEHDKTERLEVTTA